MRVTSTLVTAAAALALGFAGTAFAEDAPGAKSDITIVKEDTGNAPAAGAEESTEGQSAADEGSAAAPDPSAEAPDASDGGTAQQALPPADDEDSAGVTGDAGAPAAKPDVQKEGKLPSPSSAY